MATTLENKRVQSLREQVAAACRRLAEAGLVTGAAGNVSARDGEVIAVSPAGAALEFVEPRHVAVVDATGRVIDGDRAPTSELALHLAVYERFGSGAVLHTHAPIATSLSCVIDELPCVHPDMTLLGGSVRVAPYATFGTDALAESAVEALAGRTVALLANHGTIAHGPDLPTAVRATELLEWVSGVYWRAAQLGEPRALDADAQRLIAESAATRHHDAMESTVHDR